MKAGNVSLSRFRSSAASEKSSRCSLPPQSVPTGATSPAKSTVRRGADALVPANVLVDQIEPSWFSKLILSGKSDYPVGAGGGSWPK
jgi:hypothetical protein